MMSLLVTTSAEKGRDRTWRSFGRLAEVAAEPSLPLQRICHGGKELFSRQRGLRARSLTRSFPGPEQKTKGRQHSPPG